VDCINMTRNSDRWRNNFTASENVEMWAGISTASQITQAISCTCNLRPFLHFRLDWLYEVDDKISDASFPNVIIHRAISLILGRCNSPTQHVNLLSQTHYMGDMFRL
jgi:hypothetical protein